MIDELNRKTVQDAIELKDFWKEKARENEAKVRQIETKIDGMKVLIIGSLLTVGLFQLIPKPSPSFQCTTGKTPLQAIVGADGRLSGNVEQTYLICK
jgi:hypothetical protein